MANMASVAYAIEGSKESLECIQKAILEGLNDKKHWTEYTACKSLGFTDEELDGFSEETLNALVKLGDSMSEAFY